MNYRIQRGKVIEANQKRLSNFQARTRRDVARGKNYEAGKVDTR